MLAFCPKCWNEITSSRTTCRKCGAEVDVYSDDYQQHLLKLIPASNTAKRVEICLVLGQLQKGKAIPHLVSVLSSEQEIIVYAAAIRALSEIGDASAFQEIAKVAANEQSPVHVIARRILDVVNLPRGPASSVDDGINAAEAGKSAPTSRVRPTMTRNS